LVYIEYMTKQQRIALQQLCEHNWFEGIATQWCLKCGAEQATERFERKWQERKIAKAE
jgi:hypothetical protein